MKKLNYGMVGGGPGSFIGDAHRKPASLIKHISDINQKARAIGGRNMIYSPLSGYYKIKKYI